MQVKYLDLSCLTCVSYSQTVIEAQFVYICYILYNHSILYNLWVSSSRIYLVYTI